MRSDWPEKYGKDPNKWDNNVAEYIRLKNDPEYYNDPVCKHGYLRGSETYNYVREVLSVIITTKKSHSYKKFIAMSESSHNYEFSASKCHLKIIGDTYA